MGTRSGATPAATASYIASMLGELRSMSNQINADFLAYLLEMAVEEAAALAGERPKDTSKQPPVNDAVHLARLYMAGKLD